MQPYKTPGVFIQELAPLVASGIRTGVPAFLGYADQKRAGLAEVNTPILLTLWSQFQDNFTPAPNSYLPYAVSGFFENGGRLCYVIRLNNTLDDLSALEQGLKALTAENAIDLVCAPDILRPLQSNAGQLQPPDPAQVRRMQMAVLNHCIDAGDSFAILDSNPGSSLDQVLQQRSGLNGTNGALYYPWVQVEGGPAGNAGFIPPCGHIAGIYAGTDERVGVFKSPANEALQGVLDLETNLSDSQQDVLNPAGVNCLRAFPGRGIRVWGARTLSSDANWTYISVRRLFITVARWIGRHMNVAFEPNNPQLWARIERELSVYFSDLFRRGALKGNNAQEAFFVNCNAETNPPEVREVGMVVTEIGLAPTQPNEFIVVRIMQKASGITLLGPATLI